MATKTTETFFDASFVLVMNIEEAHTVMRVSRQTFYDEVNAGRLRTFMVGRRRLVSVEAIRDWIRDCELATASTQPADESEIGDNHNQHRSTKPCRGQLR
jgi:excisionase family DNA binding protein